MIKKIARKKVIGFDDLNDKLDRVISVMATKDDIKNMATKDDIARIWDSMATKDDIKNMATRDDIALVVENMATKEDIEKVWDAMATKEDLVEVETRLLQKIEVIDEKHDRKFREILTAVDGLATRFDRMEMENAHMTHQLQRHEGWAKIFAGKLDVGLIY